MAPRFRNKGSLNSFVILSPRENVGDESGGKSSGRGVDATEIPSRRFFSLRSK